MREKERWRETKKGRDRGREKKNRKKEKIEGVRESER